MYLVGQFFFSSRRRHTRFKCDWSSDVCSSDLGLTLVWDDTTGSIQKPPARKPEGVVTIHSLLPTHAKSHLQVLVHRSTTRPRSPLGKRFLAQLVISLSVLLQSFHYSQELYHIVR